MYIVVLLGFAFIGLGWCYGACFFEVVCWCLCFGFGLGFVCRFGLSVVVVIGILFDVGFDLWCVALLYLCVVGSVWFVCF